MDTEFERDYEVQDVEIIASGYEWECPHCEYLNRMIEIPAGFSPELTCDICGKVSIMNDFYHAFGCS